MQNIWNCNWAVWYIKTGPNRLLCMSNVTEELHCRMQNTSWQCHRVKAPPWPRLMHANVRDSIKRLRWEEHFAKIVLACRYLRPSHSKKKLQSLGPSGTSVDQKTGYLCHHAQHCATSHSSLCSGKNMLWLCIIMQKVLARFKQKPLYSYSSVEHHCEIMLVRILGEC